MALPSAGRELVQEAARVVESSGQLSDLFCRVFSGSKSLCQAGIMPQKTLRTWILRRPRTEESLHSRSGTQPARGDSHPVSHEAGEGLGGGTDLVMTSVG